MSPRWPAASWLFFSSANAVLREHLAESLSSTHGTNATIPVNVPESPESTAKAPHNDTHSTTDANHSVSSSSDNQDITPGVLSNNGPIEFAFSPTRISWENLFLSAQDLDAMDVDTPGQHDDEDDELSETSFEFYNDDDDEEYAEHEADKAAEAAKATEAPESVRYDPGAEALGYEGNDNDDNAYSSDDDDSSNDDESPNDNDSSGNNMSSSSLESDNDEERLIKQHPELNGRPCDADGTFLPKNTAPSPQPPRASDDYSPFEDHVQFETADFLYTRNQMSAGHIDELFYLWAASMAKHKDSGPFGGHRPLYETIDLIPNGDISWQSITLNYKDKDQLPDQAPAWQKADYDVWYRDPKKIIKNMLANPDFKDEIDYAPIRDHLPKSEGGGLHPGHGNKLRIEHIFKRRTGVLNLLPVKQNKIAKDPDTHRSMFVPIILGSDKTTVSVATGQNKYYPLYASIASWLSQKVINDSAADKKYNDDPLFRKFRRQLIHSSLLAILESLKAGMTKWEIFRCPDEYFCQVIFGIGPYIADYLEQALLACIVQGWCAKYTARPPNLESGGIPRKRCHTDKIVQDLSIGQVWDGYGIVADIVISITVWGHPILKPHNIGSIYLRINVLPVSFPLLVQSAHTPTSTPYVDQSTAKPGIQRWCSSRSPSITDQHGRLKVKHQSKSPYACQIRIPIPFPQFAVAEHKWIFGSTTIALLEHVRRRSRESESGGRGMNETAASTGVVSVKTHKNSSEMLFVLAYEPIDKRPTAIPYAGGAVRRARGSLEAQMGGAADAATEQPASVEGQHWTLNAVADTGMNTVVWLGTGCGPTELDARKAALKIAIERVLEEPRDKVLAFRFLVWVSRSLRAAWHVISAPHPTPFELEHLLQGQSYTLITQHCQEDYQLRCVWVGPARQAPHAVSKATSTSSATATKPTTATSTLRKMTSTSATAPAKSMMPPRQSSTGVSGSVSTATRRQSLAMKSPTPTASKGAPSVSRPSAGASATRSLVASPDSATSARHPQPRHPPLATLVLLARPTDRQLQSVEDKVAKAITEHEQATAAADAAVQEHLAKLEEIEKLDLEQWDALSEEIARINVELEGQEAKYNGKVEEIKAKHVCLRRHSSMQSFAPGMEFLPLPAFPCLPRGRLLLASLPYKLNELHAKLEDSLDKLKESLDVLIILEKAHEKTMQG
ncbi:hypothetical protein CERSUDRAFT_78623 [Gelatoporia subvermispora B]|uniref:Uncharacterized protein n=1 Tax=Ceriporiopsis subvermispora (strain B) TaxID=914234 RepID=M2QFJ0_CERS8|nr:hypothetical protein CERSUDRAFT_78623 [Gelatoporia subvermispora B]